MLARGPFGGATYILQAWDTVGPSLLLTFGGFGLICAVGAAVSMSGKAGSGPLDYLPLIFGSFNQVSKFATALITPGNVPSLAICTGVMVLANLLFLGGGIMAGVAILRS